MPLVHVAYWQIVMVQPDTWKPEDPLYFQQHAAVAIYFWHSS